MSGGSRDDDGASQWFTSFSTANDVPPMVLARIVLPTRSCSRAGQQRAPPLSTWAERRQNQIHAQDTGAGLAKGTGQEPGIASDGAASLSCLVGGGFRRLLSAT